MADTTRNGLQCRPDPQAMECFERYIDGMSTTTLRHFEANHERCLKMALAYFDR